MIPELLVFLTINLYRSSLGLPELDRNYSTCHLASIRLREIRRDGYLNHDGFYERIDRLRKSGEWYENLAKLYPNKDPIGLVVDWHRSPTHKTNLQAEATYGCVRSDGVYFVFIAKEPK